MLDRQLSFEKNLRRDMTDAEGKLWLHLRSHRLSGYKFKRQQPVGSYIVDFVCFATRLVIEVDGGQHLDSASDAKRDAWLIENGFRILRFWNDQVLKEPDAVLEAILDALEQPASPLSPTPLPQGEKGSNEEGLGT